MNAYPYLIVGSGVDGHAAAQAIRELDSRSAIGMVGEERSPPYARPPLSGALWEGAARSSIFLPPVAGLVLHAGRRAVSLDPARHEVMDEQGERYHYGRLLVATGATPRRLAVGGDRVLGVRTIEDYDRLRAVQGHVVVVGGGLLGRELAVALARDGRDVTLVFRELGLGAQAWPSELCGYVSRLFEEHGVRLLRGHSVAGVEPFGRRCLVRTDGNAEVLADAVVAGLGIRPDTALAVAGGLTVSDGIEVDEQLRTSAPDVWAAGDVARAFSPLLGARVREEHLEGAVAMGREAGRSMAGARVTWHHLPVHSSRLFDLEYEAVGRLDARLEVVCDWHRPLREGVLCYLERGLVKGVLLWGVHGMAEAARELIRRQRLVGEAELAHAIV
jgi:NADPH-dependent 2,4-dienoyl-CoA reductase/sulfur reductase-like enzyme